MSQSKDIRNIGRVRDDCTAGALENFFGVTNDVVLQRLAAQWGQPITEGGWFEKDHLKFDYRGIKCAIIADSEFDPSIGSTNNVLEFVADYAPRDGFKMRIEREGIFSTLGSLLGTGDFQIGDSNFDDAFSLDSNDNPKLKEICSKASIKRAMLKAGNCKLATEDPGWFSDVPDGMRRLRYRIVGDIGNVTALNQQLQAFGDILDGLVESGCVKAAGKAAA